MKVPFLEQTVVSIFLDKDVIRWIELSQLGKKIKLHSHGEYLLQNKQDLSSILSDIKNQITADGYLVAFSSPGLLSDLIVEEIPFFESTDEVSDWVHDHQEKILQGYGAGVLIEHHIIEVDEDHRRCLFQVIDEQKFLTYSEILQELELSPVLITPGVIETGYSQIYEDYFVEGFSGILTTSHKGAVLCCYQHGLLHNLYELKVLKQAHVLEEADSYLQSEELSTERQKGSAALVTVFDTETKAQGEIKRELKKLVPFPSNSGFKDLPEQYARACGSAIKVFFPALDSINFSQIEVMEEGVDWNDKKEATRTVAVLLTPLVLIFLLFYAMENVLDYKLVETNQVMNKIGDKIELVNEKEDDLNVSLSRFNELKNLISQRENTAIAFELINNTLPEDVWLNKLELNNTKESLTLITINGYSLREGMVTDFMGRLEKSEEVNNVALPGIQQVTKERSESLNSISAPVVGFEIEVQMVK